MPRALGGGRNHPRHGVESQRVVRSVGCQDARSCDGPPRRPSVAWLLAPDPGGRVGAEHLASVTLRVTFHVTWDTFPAATPSTRRCSAPSPWHLSCIRGARGAQAHAVRVRRPPWMVPVTSADPFDLQRFFRPRADQASKDRPPSTASVAPEPSEAMWAERDTLHHLHAHAGNQQLLEALSGGGDAYGAVLHDAAMVGLSGVHAAPLVPGSAPPSAMRAVMRKRGQAEDEGLDTARASQLLGKRSGQPLPEAVRARMERAFGQDFRHVRIHTDGAAVEAAGALNAHAFTNGRDIYFGQGAWRPGSIEGIELLAHELTHVVQAMEGRLPQATGGGLEVSSPGDAHEREAETRGRDVSLEWNAAPFADSMLEFTSEQTAPLQRDSLTTQHSTQQTDASHGVLRRNKNRTATSQKKDSWSATGATGSCTKIEGEINLRVWGPIVLTGKFTAEASKEARGTYGGKSEGLASITTLSIGLDVQLKIDLFFLSIGVGVFGSLSIKVKNAPNAAAAAYLGLKDILAYISHEKANKESSNAIPKITSAFKAAEKERHGIISELRKGIATTNEIGDWAGLADTAIQKHDKVTRKNVDGLMAAVAGTKSNKSKADITNTVRKGTKSPKATRGSDFYRKEIQRAKDLALEYSKSKWDRQFEGEGVKIDKPTWARIQVDGILSKVDRLMKMDHRDRVSAFVGLDGTPTNNPDVEWEGSYGFGATLSIQGGGDSGFKGTAEFKSTTKYTDTMGQHAFHLKKSQSDLVALGFELGDFKARGELEWGADELKFALELMRTSSSEIFKAKRPSELKAQLSDKNKGIQPMVFSLLTGWGKIGHSLKDMGQSFMRMGQKDGALKTLTKTITETRAAGLKVEIVFGTKAAWSVKSVSVKVFLDSTHDDTNEWTKRIGGKLAVSQSAYVQFTLNLPEKKVYPKLGTCSPPKTA